MTVIQDLDFVAPRDCELVAYGVAHTLIRASERVRYFGRGEGLGWEFLVGEGLKSRRLQMRRWDPVLGAQLAALRDGSSVDCEACGRGNATPRETGLGVIGTLCGRCWDSTIIGARDTRTAPVVGALQAGDTVVHSRGSLSDAEQIAHGACVAAGAKLRHVEYRSGALNVFVDGTEEQVRRVGGMVSASLSMWDEVAVIPDPPARQRGTVGDLDAVLYAETALRWLDALPMPEPKPTTCDECGAVTKAAVSRLGLCVYCTHRIMVLTVRSVERGRGINVEPKEEPGPHEGATAWASATWGEL